MSFIISQLSYIHPDREPLFEQISFAVQSGQKIALVGNNGVGKSVLLKIIAGKLEQSAGDVLINSKLYYVPQHFGQYDEMSVAEALGIAHKVAALNAITEGDASVENFAILDDDWGVEERALAALSEWGMEYVKLDRQLNTLSGGEKTKVFLSGIRIHEPSIVLLDEPSNHLDIKRREQLYEFIRTTRMTLLVVSHDRNLLNLLEETYELSRKGVSVYGGNYDFYKEQKESELNALQEGVDEKEKELRKARKVAREVAERLQREDARGKGKALRERAPRIAMNTLRNKAEQSSSRMKDVHAGKMEAISDELKQIRAELPDMKELKMNFEYGNLHKGKLLVKAEAINFTYDSEYLWKEALHFEIKSGDRLAIKGKNGSGKTTLLRLISGESKPTEGVLTRLDFTSIYVDQEYSLINNHLTVYEQLQNFNKRNFQDHELKMILSRFLFSCETWDKSCGKLSGGEKMRLVFCCMMVNNNAPDMFILDEPTNNLDVRTLEIVASVIREYKGTVVVVSHDQYFLNEIGIEEEITLSF